MIKKIQQSINDIEKELERMFDSGEMNRSSGMEKANNLLIAQGKLQEAIKILKSEDVK